MKKNTFMRYARLMPTIDPGPQPLTPDALSARIRTLLPSLPPAATKVVQLVLDDPALVSRSTIQELVDIVGTSEATIVRAARSLGFRGYPDLRFALASAEGQRLTPRRIDGDIDASDTIRDVIEKIASAEQRAIRETAAHLDPPTIDRLADAVVSARKIVIFGAGASGLVAADLHQKLMRIGLTCHVTADNHLALTEAVLLKTDDLAIAISHSGETTEALAFLQAAQRAGSTTAALTGATDSPLTKVATHVLYAAGGDSVFRPAALSSRISHLMVVDCLFVAVAQRTYDQTLAAVKTTREALQAHRHAG